MDAPLIIHWPALAGAIFLLWFPPSLWIRQSAKRNLAHQRTAASFDILRASLAWQNWADLARSFAGCFLLYGYALEAPEGEEWTLFGWRAGILLVALLLQTVRRHHGRTYFLAPIFFVWGMTLFLSGPLLAFYGIAAGILVALLADLEWKLPVMAVVVGGVGYLLAGVKLPLILNAVLIVFPLLIAFCGRGHLVFLTRLPKRAS